LQLTPAREAEIIEELSQHLDDRYEELQASGASNADARRMTLEELSETGDDSLSGCGHWHKRTRRHRSSPGDRAAVRCTGSGRIFATLCEQ